MKKVNSYGICPYLIINNLYYILLNKTSENSKLNFFKGKINKNENISNCAIREFKEETDILIKISDFEEYFYQYNRRKNIGIYLVDWTKYYKKEFNFDKKEIYSTYWKRINNSTISKNQIKIYNDISLFLYKKEMNLKRLVKRNAFKKIKIL